MSNASDLQQLTALIERLSLHDQQGLLEVDIMTAKVLANASAALDSLAQSVAERL